MFIAHHQMLDIPVQAAQARLANLVGGGGVASSSAAAYAAGIERAMRVGPFGDVPGATKLVRVKFLDPRQHDNGMTLGMRWEAMGAAGALFPVLDADLVLTGQGEHSTKLELVGSYRPPFSWLGAGLDRALLRRVATATVRALLRDVALALVDPAAAQANADRHADRHAGLMPAPLAEPETP